MAGHQFHPLAVDTEPDFLIYFDNQAVPAYHGETIVAALLRQQRHLSYSEFDGAARAGFCLMGACQDCTVWTEDGARLRACRTVVSQDQKLLSRAPMQGFAQ